MNADVMTPLSRRDSQITIQTYRNLLREAKFSPVSITFNSPEMQRKFFRVQDGWREECYIKPTKGISLVCDDKERIESASVVRDSARIGKGVAIMQEATVSDEVSINGFVMVAGNAVLSGRSRISNFCENKILVIDGNAKIENELVFIDKHGDLVTDSDIFESQKLRLIPMVEPKEAATS